MYRTGFKGQPEFESEGKKQRGRNRTKSMFIILGNVVQILISLIPLLQ